MDWNLYRTFLAVIRSGSFSTAANVLGSTQPTVSRQIDALEAELGTKLFTRSQRGLVPTIVARELIPHAEAMEISAAALRRASAMDVAQEKGVVRLTVGAQIGIEVLPPLLTEFAREYPNIELELSISNRAEDILHRESDIAIRIVRPTQKALIAKRLGKVRIGLFAHRDYIDRYGSPNTIADLTHHRLIGFDHDMHIVAAFGDDAAKLRREDFAIRTDNVTAQLALLRAGIGIAACHYCTGQCDDRLVPVLPDDIVFEREIWLVMHEDMKRTNHVRLLFDYLKKELLHYFEVPSEN